MLPEDGFLDEKDVTAGFLNLFDQVEDVSSLLTEHAVHLCVIRHHDLVIHLDTRKQQGKKKKRLGHKKKNSLRDRQRRIMKKGEGERERRTDKEKNSKKRREREREG